MTGSSLLVGYETAARASVAADDISRVVGDNKWILAENGRMAGDNHVLSGQENW